MWNTCVPHIDMWDSGIPMSKMHYIKYSFEHVQPNHQSVDDYEGCLDREKLSWVNWMPPDEVSLFRTYGIWRDGSFDHRPVRVTSTVPDAWGTPSFSRCGGRGVFMLNNYLQMQPVIGLAWCGHDCIRYGVVRMFYHVSGHLAGHQHHYTRVAAHIWPICNYFRIRHWI